MNRHRHRAPSSAPLSTKIAVGLGVGLVVLGFGIAGWQRLTADDGTETVSPTTQSAQQYLPGIGSVVGYLVVIVIAAIGGGFVLIRSADVAPASDRQAADSNAWAREQRTE